MCCFITCAIRIRFKTEENWIGTVPYTVPHLKIRVKTPGIVNGGKRNINMEICFLQLERDYIVCCVAAGVIISR